MAALALVARPGCIFGSYPLRGRTLRIAETNRKEHSVTRYTLVVGTRNWSSWSLRPFVALKATGAPHEIIDIRLRQFDSPTTREQILKHSPAGKVPVLKIAEGGKTLTIWDSLAICEALAEGHPEAGLWPRGMATRAI